MQCACLWGCLSPARDSSSLCTCPCWVLGGLWMLLSPEVLQKWKVFHNTLEEVRTILSDTHLCGLATNVWRYMQPRNKAHTFPCKGS